jgi:hypothetical protein
MPDGPVLAGGVERLQDKQHAPGVLRGQASLVLAQQLDSLVQQSDALLLLEDARLEGRIKIPGQGDLRAGSNQERLDEVSQTRTLLVRQFLSHLFSSRRAPRI